MTMRRPVLAFSVPVMGPSATPIAILVGRADLAFLDALMAERAGLGATGRSFLVGTATRPASPILLRSRRLDQAPGGGARDVDRSPRVGDHGGHERPRVKGPVLQTILFTRHRTL